jgi:transketolase
MEKGKQEATNRVTKLKKQARTIRKDIINMIYHSQSGHPGGALSCTDILTVLYFDILHVDPEKPKDPDRDRFILSKGHACPAWYACLAEKGFFDTSHLNTLRQFGSILQGHPDMNKTPGVDINTGSLGHGASEAIGMALEGKMTKKNFHVYAVLGDGELNEGIIWEAAMSAGKFSLDNLTFIIDYNHLQLDGTTEQIMPLEPLAQKFESFGWETMEIDGHDIQQIITSIEKRNEISGKPVCIIAQTVKGKGVSFMENQRGWHGKAPNDEEFIQAMKELGE